ncbi:MAG TPA: Gfo/Idh/MocA family oxidoreductase [Candidatus Acidoferrales bacterium]|nr:Gfo/Idh/MocA family oxidoreductase [Candidatus Acidoferrales bacterium]
MIHVGLIGGGNISSTHARAVDSIAGAKVVAVYGPNPAKTGNLGTAHHAAVYGNLETLLTHRPMEMVIIGSPSGLHADEGIAAARHGLHVLVEKPIDITTERADALIDACDRASVRCGVIFQERFHPENLKIKKLIDEGGLGRLLLVNAHVPWYRPPEYYTKSRWHGLRAIDGGGALMNQGVHTVDFLLWMIGDVARVQARTATVLQQMECEDTALAILEFANGAFGTLQVTTAEYPGYERRVEITGTEGTVVLEGDRIVAADLRHKREGLLSPPPASAGVGERATSAVVNDTSGHRAAIEDFIRAVRDGGKLNCDGREGRRSLELVERIYKAAGEVKRSHISA